MYYLIKILISAILIVAISEISKKSSLIGAILASLPIVSILAIIWLYKETKDIQKISELSYSIFWFVLPSLSLFIVLPLLLKKGVNFYMSILFASIITIICYYIMSIILDYLTYH